MHAMTPVACAPVAGAPVVAMRAAGRTTVGRTNAGRTNAAMPIMPVVRPPVGPFQLQHPFTMIITGPTSCGKTTLVRHMLMGNFVQPTVQRIVWLYKRWQPLYDIIQRNVWPRIEFIQGLPIDLENDDFFDPNINNLLVLDDLASVAGKDSRITDLFTEGSHHRNLSVISINQNMFTNKDPTQRRNCHYLILFNNPVDKQMISTLARQMYPGQTQYFINAFQNAVKTPRGYMLIDLKPDTLERYRLKPNVLHRDIAKQQQQHESYNQKNIGYSSEPRIKRLKQEIVNTSDMQKTLDIHDWIPY